MASTLVFPPTYRLTDSAGRPVSGGRLRFFEAGTSTPKVVYSDAALTQSLGSTVYTRSDGFPVASEVSSSVVAVYTGEDSYKLSATTSAAVVIWEQDNIIGAPVLEPTEDSTAIVPVVTTGSNVTLDATHRGKLLNVQSNTVTFPAAATLGDGWNVHIRNAGSGTGRVVLSAASGISYQGTSYTTMYLAPGQAISVACDGTAYRAYSDAVLYTPAGFRPNTPGVVMIADRITAAPATSVGSRYIVTGAYSTFSVGDIVEEVASGVFLGFTPTTDCGWVAYVQDEDTYYAFIGSAWAPVGINANGLTEDTNPDSDNDFVATYDASASGHKKIPLGMVSGSIIAIIEDQKAQNTVGQTLNTGSDQTRELNTLVFNRDSLVSIGSNRFTLPAGAWEICWDAPFAPSSGGGRTYQSLLYNFTDSTEVGRGLSCVVEQSVNNESGQQSSSGSAVVTIAGAKAFEIRSRVGITSTTGTAANFGTEVYTRVVVRRA